MSCLTMCPASERLLTGSGSFFRTGHLPAHCLLVETDRDGLVLVDTGIGVDDLQDLRGRLGFVFTTFVKPKPAPELTALAQVEALGFKASDVQHILVTHLDPDHAGGLPDFPNARVHLHLNEKNAALNPQTGAEKDRYRKAHFAHGPDWRTYETTGEEWNGFDAVRSLDGLPPEFLLVPMFGHTRGHSAIAIDRGADGWLLHAGDAYFWHEEVHATPSCCPNSLRFFQRLVAIDNKERLRNQSRLHELAGSSEVDIICSHDQSELEAHVAAPS